MKDYVLREDVLRCVEEDGCDCELDLGYPDHNVAFREIIKEIPAADVRPVVRGKWIKQEPYNQNYWKCSNCGETNKYAYRDGDVTIYELQDFFCPNCGADMREVDT